MTKWAEISVQANVLVSLYYSLFASFLQYGIIVWGLACDTHTKPIYLLQKKVVRAIAFKNFTSPSTPIFSELKILKLYDLSNLKLLTFVHESVNLISPIFFHNFLKLCHLFISMIPGRLVGVIFL